MSFRESQAQIDRPQSSLLCTSQLLLRRISEPSRQWSHQPAAMLQDLGNAPFETLLNSESLMRVQSGQTRDRITDDTPAENPANAASMVDPDAPQDCKNLVDWTLSGEYLATDPVLIDASDPSRFISRSKATELVASLVGAFAKQSAWTGSNPAYTQHELAHHFRTSETKYVITFPEHVATVEAAVRDVGYEIEVILFTDILRDQYCTEVASRLTGSIHHHPSNVTNSADGAVRRTLHDLIGPPDISMLRRQLKCVSVNDIATLQSTSGTTGLPKMATRTHGAIMQETKVIEDNNAAKPYEVRRLFCTPIFHAFSTPEMIFNPLRLGHPTYFMRRFDNSFARKVHDFGITETAAPPPMLMRLQQQVKAHHLLQSLRLIYCGGAPLAPELRTRMLQIFNRPPRIVQVWGMTEGGWFTTLQYPEDDETSSVGRLVPGYEIKMSLEHAVEMANGRVAGHLLVKGPQLMTGYLKNPQASEEAFSDAWLRTGDVGYVEEGKVYLLDRAKDLIKVNGWQVAPAELEAALLQSPNILDTAAIGVGSGIHEHPMVFVVARYPGVNACDVITHLRSRLARYKVAQIEVHFVESIPRNPSGKILRKILRSQVAEKGVIEVS